MRTGVVGIMHEVRSGRWTIGSRDTAEPTVRGRIAAPSRAIVTISDEQPAVRPAGAGNERRRLLLVEDEPALRENYALALSRAGFAVEAHAGAIEASRSIGERLPDAVIVDIGLGNDAEAGFELCRSLRAAHPRLPILFLSARDSELDVVSGLRLGADDYLTKDVSLAELVARVNALLRRIEALSRPPEEDAPRRVGELTLDERRLEVRWREEPVALTVSEFHVVACLARHPGQVRSRTQLMEAAGLVLDEQTITAQVKRIRAKFLALDRGFTAIRTVYGLGYRWLAPPDR